MVAASYLVTGGAGFIGTNLVHRLLGRRDDPRTSRVRVAVVDRLTYAGNRENLVAFEGDPRFQFVRADICDADAMRSALEQVQPDIVFNLAAESHVDRSIDGPREFVRTNVSGTFELLEASRAYSSAMTPERQARFRFIHVSTDEVFGSLGPEGYFTESTPYAPRSPYAASKAAADHLAHAYFHTYGVPVVVTNCSNNYGPYQFPEKLVPLVTLNALEGKPLPVYGDGRNVRDWLFVDDHCEALMRVAARGVPGETYNIGGNSERTTLQIVETICDVLDSLVPQASSAGVVRSYREQIAFVADRPGHDRRYAIDATKIRRDLDWAPATPFDDGIHRTLAWYLEHRGWCDRITAASYRRERLGLSTAPPPPATPAPQRDGRLAT